MWKAIGIRGIAFSVAALLGLMGCGDKGGSASGAAGSAKPIVAVTVPPQAFAVKRIGGDTVDVRVMIPGGANHETYEPTMEQMIGLSKAALYVKVGHPHFSFEKAWLDKLLAESPGTLKVVQAGPLTDGQDSRDEDPHEWVTPAYMRALGATVAAELSRINPAQQALYAANRIKLEADLDQLDEDLEALFAGKTKRRFYIYHPAFGHLAKAYGLEQVAIEQGHREPSPEELARTVAAAKADGAKIIFVQPQISDAAAQTVAAEIGARIVAIDPLAEDFLANTRKVGTAIAGALEP